jgi:hypothetical protein
MLKFNQGWVDIEAMPEHVFWAYVGLADELNKQEQAAMQKAKAKGRR